MIERSAHETVAAVGVCTQQDEAHGVQLTCTRRRARFLLLPLREAAPLRAVHATNVTLNGAEQRGYGLNICDSPKTCRGSPIEKCAPPSHAACHRAQHGSTSRPTSTGWGLKHDQINATRAAFPRISTLPPPLPGSDNGGAGIHCIARVGLVGRTERDSRHGGALGRPKSHIRGHPVAV